MQLKGFSSNFKLFTVEQPKTKTFIMRFRTQTCKIILATSLIWFLVDVVLLIYYTDCGGSGCAGAKGEPKGPSAEALVHYSENQVHRNNHDTHQNDVDFDSDGDLAVRVLLPIEMTSIILHNCTD